LLIQEWQIRITANYYLGRVNIFKGVFMIKKISIIAAACACVCLNGMEVGSRYRITNDPHDYLEPHYGRTEQFFEDNKDINPAEYPVIAEVGVMTGLIAKHIRTLAPKSEIIGIIKSESPLKYALENDNKSGICFQQQDIQNLKLEKPANLLLFLGQLPYVKDKKAFIDVLAKNIAPNGVLITTCVTPNNSSLVKTFLEVKEDSQWKKDLDPIDINKIWMPASREEIEKNLQEAGLTVKKVTLVDSPVIFRDKDAFKSFINAVTSGIKARTGNAHVLNDEKLLDTYLETMKEKYLSYHPEKEDGSVEYLLPENFFVAEKMPALSIE
jgi:trans-aconitate methyltransferase